MIIFHHLDDSRSQCILWLLEELGFTRDPALLSERPGAKGVELDERPRRSYGAPKCSSSRLTSISSAQIVRLTYPAGAERQASPGSETTA
jgi:hypothetical protein